MKRRPRRGTGAAWAGVPVATRWRLAPCSRALLAALLVLVVVPGSVAAPSSDAEPAGYVAFVEDFAGSCVARNGVRLLVKSTHPTRKLRVWLDRYHLGSGTGDRSRTDLLPGAEPEPLGCSRTSHGAQEWRLVRALFID